MMGRKNYASDPLFIFMEWLQKEHPDLYQKIYKEIKNTWKI